MVSQGRVVWSVPAPALMGRIQNPRLMGGVFCIWRVGGRRTHKRKGHKCKNYKMTCSNTQCQDDFRNQCKSWVKVVGEVLGNWNKPNLLICCISTTIMWNHAKNSMKHLKLKRPTALISHWFPVEMVHNGPKLCKRKRFFLRLEHFSEVSRVYHLKADVQGFLKMW